MTTVKPSLNARQTSAAAIQSTLRQVEDALLPLCSALQAINQSASHFEHYLLHPPFAQSAAEWLGGEFDRPFSLCAALFGQLDYLDAEGAPADARTTLQIPGLLAVPQEIIDYAQTLNIAKQQFTDAIADFRAAWSDKPAHEVDRQLREQLATAGHPRLHLRQTYRQVLLCPQHPDALSLSWIKARKSIRKVSIRWCEKKLIQLDPQGSDPGIQYQLQLLADLPANQGELLRQVQIQSRPNLQVAEIFRGEDGEEDTYRQVGYATMPVLVRADPGGRLPEFSRVDHQPAAGRRRQRRDLALGRDPFLPALRVYLREG